MFPATPRLNRKESEIFLKKMHETEERPPTKEEKELAKELSKYDIDRRK